MAKWIIVPGGTPVIICAIRSLLMGVRFSMNDKTTTSAYAAAIIGSAVLWIATSLISGRTEAWDSSLYWTFAYPFSIVLAAVLGYRFPVKPWRWGLTVMLGPVNTI